MPAKELTYGPEYQAPKEAVATQAEFEAPAARAAKDKAAAVAPPWPATLSERIAAVRDLVARGSRTWTLDEVAKSFKRARRADVEAVLDSLAALGLLVSYDLPDARRWQSPTRSAA